MSRVGKAIITVPDKVSVVNENGLIKVKGPKGESAYQLPSFLTFEQKDNKIEVKSPGKTREDRMFHGTARARINNMVKGVSEGFIQELEIHGIGFKAAVKGNAIDLKLGQSHPVLHPIPANVKVTVADETKIKIEGHDKEVIGQLAAEIIRYYPPEPYKGKGVRRKGQQIRRKEGKTAQSK